MSAAVAASMLLLACILAWRAAERHGLGRQRIAIVGEDWLVERLARRFERPGRRVSVAGRFADDRDGLASVLRLARAGSIDRIVLAFSGDEGRIRGCVRALGTLDIPVARYASFAQSDWSQAALERIDGVPMATLRGAPIPRWGRALKTMQDKLLSLVLIVIVLPVLLAIILAIRLDSRGPILFRQKREGRNGVEFEILKFRTMIWHDTGQARPGRVRQTARGDSRVTRVGRILRATSLDELPQLLNVLAGDMSLIGPRPHPGAMTTENRLSVEIAEDYQQRHRVKPGMTGWAQVNGSRGGLATAEDLCRRLRYDLDYIENWSPLLDLKITLLTPLKLVFHGGSAF